MNKDEHTEPLKDYAELKGFTPLTPLTLPHMVQIPLEEYRRYIESTIKGPTVEIPLEEYDRLRTENMELQDRVRQAERVISELQGELERQRDRQEEIDSHTDVVTQMVADGIVDIVLKDLLMLSEEKQREIRLEVEKKWQQGRQ